MKTIYTLIIISILSLKSFANNGFTVDSIPSNLLLPNTYSIRDMAFDSNVKKYFAFLGAGLGVLTGSTWTFYNTSNSNIPSNNIYKVIVDANHHCWLIDQMNLIYFDGTSFTSYDLPFISDNSSTIKERNGVVYISKPQFGFTKFNAGIFTNFSVSNSGIIDNRINEMVIDANGILWIATVNGLSKFAGNQFVNYSTINSNLSGNNIISMYPLGNEIWMHVKDNNSIISVEKIANGIVYKSNQLFDIPFNLSSTNLANSLNRTFITRGPNGGIIFPYLTNRLVEIYNGKLKIYFATDTNLFKIYHDIYTPFKGFVSNSKVNFDNTNGVVWIIGTNNKLYKFKLSDYNGFALADNGQNTQFLDINNVKAAINLRGNMFYDTGLLMPRYEVPKGSGKNTYFFNELCIGGVDTGGSLHLSASSIMKFSGDFSPGPLDTIS